MAKRKPPEASKQQQKKQSVGTEQKETSPNKATTYSSEEVIELADEIAQDLLAYDTMGRGNVHVLRGDVIAIDDIFNWYKPRNRGVAAAALRRVASNGGLVVLERVRQGRYRVAQLGHEEPVTNGRRPVSDTSVSKTKVHDTWQSVILETNMRFTGPAGDDPEVFYMTNEVGDVFVARVRPVTVPKV